MWRIRSLFLFAMVALWSCGDEADTPGANDRKAPAFVPGYPQVFAGAVSADIVVQTNAPAEVYYAIASEEVTLTPSELKNIPAGGRGGIIASGHFNIDGNEPDTVTVTSLGERSGYHLYLIPLGDDTTTQQVVNTKTFTTLTRQDTSSFQSVAENREVRYLVYRPEEVLKYGDKKYPIAFFLGGYGERADDNESIAIIKNGLLPEYIYKGNDVPMIVMSIQHVQKDWNVELVAEGMDHGLQAYPGDPDRVYLIGTSGGAFGVWSFAETYPDRLAAIVPISGGGDLSKACAMKDIGVWAFHNEEDALIHPGKSVTMIDAIKQCAGTSETRLQLFPDSGHNCWKRVFDQNHPDWAKSPNIERVDIYSWLLNQSR